MTADRYSTPACGAGRGLPAYQQGSILNMARYGSLDATRGYDPTAVLAARETPLTVIVDGRMMLTAAGAEVAFHAWDGERGLDTPFHEGWVTNAEARALGLPTYVPPVVLYWDGTAISEWVHP